MKAMHCGKGGLKRPVLSAAREGRPGCATPAPADRGRPGPGGSACHVAGNALRVGVAARPGEVGEAGEAGEAGGQPGLTRTDRVVPTAEGGWGRVGATGGEAAGVGAGSGGRAQRCGPALPFPPQSGMLPWPFPRWDAGREQAPGERGSSPFGDPGKVRSSGGRAPGEPGTPPQDR